MKYWKKLPLKVRKEITSILITFAVAMGMAFAAWLDGAAPFSWAAFWAVVATGARSGVKSAVLLAISWLKR